MPNRILREGILTSERVERLNWAEEVFYRRLMSVVDDFGRYYARPALLLAACYPLLLKKVSDSDIEKWLSACENAALVRVYPAEDGKRYLQLLDFKQQVRAAVSKFPPMPSECAADATQPQSTPPASAHLDVSVFGDVFEDGVDTRKREKPAGFTPPDWINRAHWDAWHSCPKRKEATDAQKQLSVEKLDGWRQAGEDFATALENAAVGGYQGLFLPDKPKTNPAEIRTTTVPAKPGKDPTLLAIEADRKAAAPVPQATREFLAKLKPTGATQ